MESAIDSWGNIDVHQLSEVKDIFFSEYNDEEINIFLRELNLINKAGHPSKKALNDTILSNDDYEMPTIITKEF